MTLLGRAQLGMTPPAPMDVCFVLAWQLIGSRIWTGCKEVSDLFKAATLLGISDIRSSTTQSTLVDQGTDLLCEGE